MKIRLQQKRKKDSKQQIHSTLKLLGVIFQLLLEDNKHQISMELESSLVRLHRWQCAIGMSLDTCDVLTNEDIIYCCYSEMTCAMLWRALAASQIGLKRN